VSQSDGIGAGTGLRGTAGQLARYGAVSAVALGLDLGVYASALGTGMAAPVAGVIGYAAGLVLHFALSCWVVFDARATAKSWGRLFGEFALSGLLGLGATWSIIAMVTAWGSGPALAKGLAVVVSFFLVFAVRKGIVFAARM